MIRYRVYHRKIRQVCDVVVCDNEKEEVVLEYIDKGGGTYPYKVVKKRIAAKMNADLETIRFTEKYDMRNNPIYDGDVIREYDFISGQDWVGLIRWNKDRGQFIEVMTNTPLASMRLSTIEKVGNIWEKPELLDLFQEEGN